MTVKLVQQTLILSLMLKKKSFNLLLVSEDLMMLGKAEEGAADDIIRYIMLSDAQLESFSLLSLTGM